MEIELFCNEFSTLQFSKQSLIEKIKKTNKRKQIQKSVQTESYQLSAISQEQKMKKKKYSQFLQLASLQQQLKMFYLPSNNLPKYRSSSLKTTKQSKFTSQDSLIDLLNEQKLTKVLGQSAQLKQSQLQSTINTHKETILNESLFLKGAPLIQYSPGNTDPQKIKTSKKCTNRINSISKARLQIKYQQAQQKLNEMRFQFYSRKKQKQELLLGISQKNFLSSVN